MNKKAFSMIEILVVVSVIFLLMGLVTGAIGPLRSRGKTIQSQNNLAILTRALLIYKEAVGVFPNKGMDAQNRVISLTGSDEDVDLLVQMLTSELRIKNHNGRVVKVVDPVMDFDKMVEENIIEKNFSDASKYFFTDAWGNKILYFYGSMEEDIHPYQSLLPVDEIDSTYFYNVNWPGMSFDLLSMGVDGKSDPLDAKSQKNDLSNFK